MAKTKKKAISKQTETVEKIAENAEITPNFAEKAQKTSVKSGKYRFLKTYAGRLGVFESGKIYDLSSDQAKAFATSVEAVE